MNYIENLLKGQKVEWKTLGEVCDLSNTGVDKKVNSDEQKVRLLNFVDVFKNQYINNETPTMIVSASNKKIQDCNILKGDIFITPSSEIIDEIGFSSMAIEDFENAVYSYHIMRLRIKDKNEIYPKYLNYLFQSDSLRKQIRKNAQGITRFGLTQPKWKSLQIPLPLLTVQKEIANILDTFTTLEAELEAELDCRKRQYHHYRDTLLTFGDNVEWKTLGEVAEYIRGIIYNKTKELQKNEDGWKVLRANNISLSSNSLNFDDVKIIDKNVKVRENQKLTKGDVLICAGSGSKEHIGKVAYISNDLDYTFGGFMGVIRGNKEINSRFLFHILMSDLFRNYLSSVLSSSTINNLNANIVNSCKIPLPPLAVQKEIANILDKFNELEKELEKELELRKKQYEYYRNNLLSFNEIGGVNR